MRADLPTGIVTLLFTDIEGSTRLLHDVGDERYAEILAEHHRTCRRAWSTHGGVEVDTQGDAFFVAFASAVDAVTAALAAQHALADGPVNVRMGMHTGDVLVRETGYVGRELHLAARIASAGHGGQIILSGETRRAAGESWEFLDLGEHRLKDIEHPVAIFQVGAEPHPPLKTISNTNLPTPVSSFLGRERELDAVLDRLEQGARLVTLTGPGGTGKTRLAIEAASSVVERYPAGVFWIDLTAVRNPALVIPTIAQTLGAKDPLADHIGQRRLLLVLDNLEQVLDAAPQIGALLRACPQLTMIVTSRELLRITGEVEYPVPPLAQPDAVALFCARAQRAPSADIAELCTRLDHLPLAVELAAARAGVLSPAQILQRLSRRLDLLKGGRDADPRQQTLRAAIEWSHELLSGEEQALFRRLSVFSGGWTLEASEEIATADLDTMASLVDKSLVRFSDGRYGMLETIRHYASERLAAADEAAELRRRHAPWFAQLATALGPSVRDRQADAVATLDREHDNLRAALDVALDGDDVAMASDLLSGLWFYWLTSGQADEAVGWAMRYLATSRQETPPLARILGDDAASEILRFTGRLDQAEALKHDIIAIAEADPDALLRGIPLRFLAAGTWSDIAWMALGSGRIDEARMAAEQGLRLRREEGRPTGIAHALMAAGAVAFHQDDYDRAHDLFREAAEGYEGTQIDTDWAEARIVMAQCDLLRGRPESARVGLRRLLPDVMQFGDGMMELAAIRVAAMIAAARDAESSAALFGATDRMIREQAVEVFTTHEAGIQTSFLTRIRTVLGEPEFLTAYDRGHELSRDDVVALTLAVLE